MTAIEITLILTDAVAAQNRGGNLRRLERRVMPARLIYLIAVACLWAAILGGMSDGDI
jgi:hypothetical protein